MSSAEDISVDEALARTPKNEIRAKVAGSCFTAAVYLSYISPYSRPVHSRTEIDMVFEAPL